MKTTKQFDIIIIGGSYSGLAAAMALGRALKRVLIIDNGKPCNRQTPYSHNFLTQDGKNPTEISQLGMGQVKRYSTIQFFSGLATVARQIKNGFEIQTGSGEIFQAEKLLFATGIKDIMPALPGFADCWGISVLHCPYCHGYEIKNENTAVLANGEYGYELIKLISNWTKDLTLFTNGKSTLTPDQSKKLKTHWIRIIETEVKSLAHQNGFIQNIIAKDGSAIPIKAIYTRIPFEQHCSLPATLGCELTSEGYIRVDQFMETTVTGVYACGDNVTRMRTVANAVAMGTTAGMVVSKKMIFQKF